jgi:hypothetical protein
VELPSITERIVNHPGVVGYAMRDQDEYNDSIRHDALVQNLRDIRGQHPEEFQQTIAGTRADGTPVYWGEVPIDQDTTPSPYKWRGIAAAGQPLREGSDWIRSVFSIPQNALRVFGGSANQVDAESDLAKGLDTALMGVPSIVSGQDPNPEWSSSKDRPFSALDRLLDHRNSQGLMEASPTHNARDGITTFAEAFRDIGAPNSVATDVAGGVLDAVTDPFPLGPAAIKSAIGKKYGTAAIQLGADLIPQVGLNYWMSPARRKGK